MTHAQFPLTRDPDGQHWRSEFAAMYMAREICTPTQAELVSEMLCPLLDRAPPAVAIRTLAADRALAAALRRAVGTN